ncbi:MAG TPA: YoaK family protein [Acidimicrobiales bacterium]|nr:YoaK family protein [Acidimicrobiales bacterium]
MSPPEDAADGGPAEWVARFLAVIGGFVDALGYVALFRLFTAHQSGNSVGLGVALGAGDWTEAWRRGVAIGAYVAGTALGTVVVELGHRRWPRLTGLAVLGAELVALGAALAVGEVAARSGVIAPADTASYATVAALLAGAMGLQTVVLRRVGRQTIRTTFVTGVLTNLAETFVVACFRRRRQDGAGRFSYSGLLGSIWLLYLGGAVAGGVAERSWSFAALGLPMAGLTIVAAWAARTGYRPTLPDAGPAE